MRCSDCCYFWKDEDEEYPSCHWESRAPGDVPPCEYEENNGYDKGDYEEDDESEDID